MAKESNAPKKKHNWKTIGIVILIICVVSVIVSIVMPSEEKEEETQVAQAETEAETSGAYEWDAGELAYLGLDRNQLLEIYNAYNEALLDESGDGLLGEDYLEWEDNVRAEVAEEYGIEPEDADNILFAGALNNYFATFDVDDVKLSFGDVVSVMVNGGRVVIEANVSDGWNNKDQIERNYRNAAKFIRDYIGDEDYEELQYWAVGKMTDGSESKYISFTVPSSVFPRIINQTISDTDLGDYVEDLWLLPSLREE